MTEYLHQLPEDSLKRLGFLMNRLSLHRSKDSVSQTLIIEAMLEIEDILKSIISIES